MHLVAHADELSRNAGTRCRFSDAAFQHIIHTELLADLTDTLAAILYFTAEVRAITPSRFGSIAPSCEIISSVMPSAK